MLNCIRRQFWRAAATSLAFAAVAGFTGCQSTAPVQPEPAPASAAASESSLLLNAGDVLHISFPGAPNLDTTQTVRRDGKITVDPAGELQASGLTPHEVEQEILSKVGSVLLVKQVSVTVQSSGFVIYVTGAVNRGGQIVADRRLTPLEAVIEAGLDMQKSNLKHVTVIREAANGHTEKFKLDLQAPLRGYAAQPFILQPLDIIYVPEKFSWY